MTSEKSRKNKKKTRFWAKFGAETLAVALVEVVNHAHGHLPGPRESREPVRVALHLVSEDADEIGHGGMEAEEQGIGRKHPYVKALSSH